MRRLEMWSRRGVSKLHKNAKIELIQGVPLFAPCSRRELRAIAGLADDLTLPAGRTLTNEGATGYEFLVFVEGAAEVRRQGHVVNTLHSGDFLGEIALLNGVPRTATVTTTEPSRMLVITAHDFKLLLQRLPSVQQKVLDARASRLPDELRPSQRLDAG
jgi:CRP/FNR family transcriptional regulator, cyclic AMP receptor protein